VRSIGLQDGGDDLRRLQGREEWEREKGMQMRV